MPTAPTPQPEAQLPVMRAIFACQQQIARRASRDVQARGLTLSQFDVLVTLGDSSGMLCREIGEQALISQGTLTPVLDRLEAKGLIQRTPGERDRRQTVVSLTAAGQALYERTFMPHVAVMRPYFDALTPAEQADLIARLDTLTHAFKRTTGSQPVGKDRQP